MSDLNETLAQEAAELINGGEWRDGKWYSDGHRDAWRKALKPAADRIEKLEAALDEAAFSQTLFDAVVGQRNKATDRIEKLESVTKDDAKWLAAYHKWCEMNGCAPSSSDLISARKALEENK